MTHDYFLIIYSTATMKDKSMPLMNDDIHAPEVRVVIPRPGEGDDNVEWCGVLYMIRIQLDVHWPHTHTLSLKILPPLSFISFLSTYGWALWIIHFHVLNNTHRTYLLPFLVCFLTLILITHYTVGTSDEMLGVIPLSEAMNRYFNDHSTIILM